jgi:hypothetical protein
MKILIFETNLMWSSRLIQSVRSLGHEAVLCNGVPETSDGASVAIVNLGETKFDPAAITTRLHELGVKVIAHAGHKEKQLIELGRGAGVDVLATNGQLTFKLDQLLRQVEIPEQGEPPI